MLAFQSSHQLIGFLESQQTTVSGTGGPLRLRQRPPAHRAECPVPTGGGTQRSGCGCRNACVLSLRAGVWLGFDQFWDPGPRTMHRKTIRNEGIFCHRATRGHREKKERWRATARIKTLLASPRCFRCPLWLICLPGRLVGRILPCTLRRLILLCRQRLAPCGNGDGNTH